MKNEKDCRLNPEELALRWRIPRDLIYRLIQGGNLPAEKIDRRWTVAMEDAISFEKHDLAIHRERHPDCGREDSASNIALADRVVELEARLASIDVDAKRIVLAARQTAEEASQRLQEAVSAQKKAERLAGKLRLRVAALETRVHELEGISIAAVAEELKVTESRIKRLLSQGKMIVKKPIVSGAPVTIDYVSFVEFKRMYRILPISKETIDGMCGDDVPTRDFRLPDDVRYEIGG